MWYLDGDLVYGIPQSALNATGSLIPLEPMYIVANVAMSLDWGMPTPCTAISNCPACGSCYDCHNAGYNNVPKAISISSLYNL